MIDTSSRLLTPSRRRRRVAPVLAAVLWALLAVTTASSQDAGAPEDGSHFAHVRFLSGEAELVRAFDGDRVPLDLNLPIIAGDRIEAAGEAWLELGLSDASLLHARGPLLLDVHALSAAGEHSESLTHLQLHRGDLSLRVTGMEQSPDKAFQVDTPSGTCYLMTDGLYRLSVEEGGSTVVTVREGVAEVSGDGGTTLVRSGQASRLVKGQSPTRPGPQWARADGFDQWVDERQQDYMAALPAGGEDLPEPVRPYAADLAQHGTWEMMPEYGMVWYPSDVPTGWYPYYHGYWVGSPAGHIWVSYEPWGWIPYHYGRWGYRAGLGWFWIPGPVFAGAWVHWWVGPSYVSWVPLGYDNRPVVELAFSLSFHRAPYGGWACVPYREFHARDLPHKYVRKPGIMKAHLDESVPVRRLPDFHPRHLRSSPNFGSEIVRRARGSNDDLPRRRFHSASVRPRPTRGTVRRATAPNTRQRRVTTTTIIQVQTNRGTRQRTRTTGTLRRRMPATVRDRAADPPGSNRGTATRAPEQTNRQRRGPSERGVTDLLRQVTKTPSPRRATPRSNRPANVRSAPDRPQKRTLRGNSPPKRPTGKPAQMRNSSSSKSRKQGSSEKSVRSRSGHKSSGKKTSTRSRSESKKSSPRKPKRSSKPKPRLRANR